MNPQAKRTEYSEGSKRAKRTTDFISRRFFRSLILSIGYHKRLGFDGMLNFQITIEGPVDKGPPVVVCTDYTVNNRAQKDGS